MRIAFQGEAGAYSEEAVLGLRPDSAPVPTPSFERAARAVIDGHVDAALLPVENSRAGSVGDVIDLLAQGGLHAIAETFQPVHHCLLALPGTEPEQVQVVHSHPQALSQCRKTIERHGWKTVPQTDTAGSARLLAEEKWPQAAVIASERAAVHYGLTVLQRNIQDVDSNTTRFLLVQREAAEPPHDGRAITTLAFTLPHEAGSLHRALALFAAARINLSRIESRPSGLEPWKYVFLIDLEASLAEERCHLALELLKIYAASVTVIGSYLASSTRFS